MTVALDYEIMPLLIEHLSAQSEVTALLGTRPCRVFGGDVPQRVDSVEIKPPWVNLERVGWEEETHLGGSDGCFRCQVNVVVLAATHLKAGQIYSVVRSVLHAKWSTLWASRLWIGESQMSMGTQVPLVEADGSPSAWQQVIGELFFLCSVVP